MNTNEWLHFTHQPISNKKVTTEKNRKHNTMMETQKDSAKKSHGRTTLINDSAIAERLCNALWLSVDSFNSTITQAKFFSSKVTSASDSPARTIQCCSAVFEPCCYIHDSRTTVTVYSTRPRLVGLALYTVTNDPDCLQSLLLGPLTPVVNKNPAAKCDKV